MGIVINDPDAEREKIGGKFKNINQINRTFTRKESAQDFVMEINGNKDIIYQMRLKNIVQKVKDGWDFKGNVILIVKEDTMKRLIVDQKDVRLVKSHVNNIKLLIRLVKLGLLLILLHLLLARVHRLVLQKQKMQLCYHNQKREYLE